MLVAIGVAAVMRIFLPLHFALFGGLPFFVIGAVAGWRQLRRPGPARIAKTLERARALPAEEFCAALAKGFEREGYSASRADNGADLRITRKGIVTLVACRRWKAGRTGAEPLREFDAATKKEGAHARMYVATGEVTDNARQFARERNIQLLGEEDVARLLR